MRLTFSGHDKEIIRLVDAQVKGLLDKKVPNQIVLETLFEYIPEIQCMVNAVCEKQLDLYCREYRYFNYFLKLIERVVGEV